MMRILLKSKIHRATVTDANVDYMGSITISRDLMKKADIWPGEKVLVVDIDNGCVYNSPGKFHLCAFELSSKKLYFQENIEIS